MKTRTSIFVVLALMLTAVWAVQPANAAIVIDVTDDEFVGTVVPGSPANPEDEAGYINNLITLDAGDGPETISGHTYDRRDSDLADPGPGVDTTMGNFNQNSGATSVTLPTTFYYVLGKYGNTDLVWYFEDGISGEIEMPASYGASGLSHTSAYNGVPEPATFVVWAGLAGLGAAAAGARRRRSGKGRWSKKDRERILDVVNLR